MTKNILKIIFMFISCSLLLLLLLLSIAYAEELSNSDIMSLSSTDNYFEGGTGTASNPYQIKTANQLKTLADLVNSNDVSYNSKNYILVDDIDLSIYNNWVPIGFGSNSTGTFKGTFDGQGHKIINMNIEINNTSYSYKTSYGLFGKLTANATIKNVEIDDAQISLNSSVTSTKDITIGILAGSAITGSENNKININNCIVNNSNITINESYVIQPSVALFMGGILGDAGDAVSYIVNIQLDNLYSNVNITTHDEQWGANGNNSNKYYQFLAGGIVGRLRMVYTMPTNCVYTGTITSTNAFIGPIYASYRNGEGNSFNQYDKLYGGYYMAENSTSYSNLYFRDYVVNGKEIGSDFETDEELKHINFNDSLSNTIIFHTLGDLTDGDDEEYMKRFQGVNRGEYSVGIQNELLMFNSNTKYNYKWYYLNNEFTFYKNEKINIETITSTKYEAVYENEDGYSIKWYIDNKLQSETSNYISVEKSLLDLILKVELYKDDILIDYCEEFISKTNLDISIEKSETNDIISYNVIYNNMDEISTFIDSLEYNWYEISQEESGEYTEILLSNTSRVLTDTDEKFGYKVEVKYLNDIVSFAYYCSKKYVFVNYDRQTINGVTYAIGSDLNSGLSPYNAVKTIEKAYAILEENKNYDEQYIIIIGNYLSTIYSDASINNSSVFNKNATITSKFLGVDYNGVLALNNDRNFLNANTRFENITIYTDNSKDLFIYAQGYYLEMGQGIICDIKKKASINYSYTGNTPSFTLIGGFENYSDNSKTVDRIGHIVIRSGHYSRVVGGNRNTGDYKGYKNNGLAFTKENPFNSIIEIDIEEQKNPYGYYYDIDLVLGGQTDGSVYLNSIVTIENGNIGRLIGGSMGHGHETDNNIPVDSYFGSIEININGGKINELYSGSLGRNAPLSYFYGKATININGGEIEGNVFGSGAGGVAGFSNDSSIYPSVEEFNVVKSLLTNATMQDIDGNTFSLENTASYLNINGGTIKGDVYGGGRGYSQLLDSADKIAYDGGSLYGNTTVTITGGTIKGNIYGGSCGSSFYGETRTKLAQVKGNVNLTITGNPTIEGNIYAGGKGVANDEVNNIDYSDMSKITGNVTLNINSKDINFNGIIYGGGAISKIDGDVIINLSNISANSIYGGGDIGIINGNLTLNIDNVSVDKTIYGGGNDGDILGNITLSITDSTIGENIYGGGNSANIDGNIELEIISSEVKNNIYGGCNLGNVSYLVNIKLDNVSANEVYGGGNNGDISTTNELNNSVVSTVTVHSGTYNNIFGGGNLGKINGDTYVKVGKNNTETNVLGVVYGGGRGANSSTETVTGSSNVLITGINTYVNNYGSIKLGKVSGNVFVLFKDYYVNNPTNPYKVMNGIDRATTVSFDNSYVLLENIVDGVLHGIEDIENIELPSGSGLKISANSHISGNFIGGGKLYLDSACCLEIDGNISGITTLILNPKLLDSNTSIIVGDIDHPYVKVKGDSEADYEKKIAIRLVSAQSNAYEISTKIVNDSGEEKAFYYIPETIQVNDIISEIEINTTGKKFISNIEGNDDITILSNRSFTSLISLSYSFLDDGTKDLRLQNVTKSITIEDYENNKITVPAHTKIIMINNERYYYYELETNTKEISLEVFKSFEEGYYDNNFNLLVNEFIVSETQFSKLYSHNEEYKFIFDFSKCNTFIMGTNYVRLNIYDELAEDEIVPVEFSLHETNMVNYLTRNYSFDTNIDSPLVVANKLELNTDIKISELPKSAIIPNKYVSVRVSILDENNNKVNIPANTEVLVEDKVYLSENGVVTIRLTKDYLTTKEVSKNIKFTFDVSNVLPQDKLKNGSYKLKLEYGLSSEDILDEVVKQTDIIDFDVRYYITRDFMKNYGLKIEVLNDNKVPEYKSQIDKYNIISYGENEDRTLKITYNSNLDKEKLILKTTKKDENTGEYVLCEGITFNKDILELTDVEEITKNITAHFSDELDNGIYRIYILLYDEYDNILTNTYVNFIVYDY